MPDTSLKKIAVLDANSYAGHGATFHLALTGDFTVQAVAEKYSRKSAGVLNNLKVEPHVVDFKNVSEEILYSILKDTDGLFLVFDTDQNHFDLLEFSKKLLQAIKKSRIRFLLFCSTVSPLRQLGRRSTRCEKISEVELQVRKMPLTWNVLVQPLHYEALLKQMLPLRLGPDRFKINYPNSNCGIEAMALDDMGPIVVSIMKNFDSYRFQTISVSADTIYLADMVNSFNKIMPPMHFEGYEMSYEDYETSVSEQDPEWGNIFMSFAIADVKRNRDISLRLNPELRSLHHWLVDNYKHFIKLFDKP